MSDLPDASFNFYGAENDAYHPNMDELGLDVFNWASADSVNDQLQDPLLRPTTGALRDQSATYNSGQQFAHNIPPSERASKRRCLTPPERNSPRDGSGNVQVQTPPSRPAQQPRKMNDEPTPHETEFVTLECMKYIANIYPAVGAAMRGHGFPERDSAWYRALVETTKRRNKEDDTSGASASTTSRDGA